MSWYVSNSAMITDSTYSIPARPTASRSLCPWARHFTHLALCECLWLLYVWGGGRKGRRRWMAATLPSVCPRAAVATIVVYHHQYDWVWMNGTWNPVRRFGWLEKVPYKSNPLLLLLYESWDFNIHSCFNWKDENIRSVWAMRRLERSH